MPDEMFENIAEDEAGANEQTDEEEVKVKDKESSSVGAKQGKIRSKSRDGSDRDRFSSSSKKQAALQNGSGTRSGRPSNAESDPAPPVNPVAQQPAIPPPWPEWSDEFINEETWDVDTGIDYFEDAFAATDLLNLKAYHWMRPSEFLREPPVVVRFSSTVIDLITPNAHLCEKSEVLRYILSEISELYDYSIQNKFVECEGEGVAYVPNYAEDDRKWAPWGHIYSCCKAGVRGERPVYNSKGKYYVRLYFLGSWRRILVDDRVPVLPSGQSGLPLTSLNELWPLLLTKALLKLATVSWKGEDVKKFSAISALTGWVFEWIDSIDGVNESELWADLENTLPKYNDPKRIPSCYTLLRPSKKKMKFGNNIEESDTFWWMPPIAVHPSDMEDATLKEVAEGEPFELEVRDIVSNIYPRPPPIEPSEDEEETQIMLPKIPLDVRWVRKTVKVPPPPPSTRTRKSVSHLDHESKLALDHDHGHSGISHGIKSEQEGQEADKTFSDKPENLHAIDGMTVAKKKKKKGGIGAALEDTKSEKKSMGAKKHKKQKELEGPDGGKSKAYMKKKSRQVSTVFELAQEQETTDGEEEATDTERLANRRKSVKLKGPVKDRWNKLKAIIVGDPEEVVNVRMSKSGRKSMIERIESTPTGRKVRRRKRKDTGESEEEEMSIAEEQEEETTPKKKGGLPSVPEILYGVQKYAGLDYRNIVKNWENICGKDSPLALIVVLKEFPSPEEETLEGPKPHVPPFLQHPIQLTEVRDSVLQVKTDRPETPLWKRFRWKKWAMRKGLIPLEVDHSNDIIRAVKAKTPFVFKEDWYDFTTRADIGYEEEDGEEFNGEDDDDDDNTMTTFFFSLKSARSKKHNSSVTAEPSVIPPSIKEISPTPTPTKVISPPPPSVGKGRNSKASLAALQPPGHGERLSKVDSTRTAVGPPGQNEALGAPTKEATKHQTSRKKSMMTTKSGAASVRKNSVPKTEMDKGSPNADETSEGQGSNLTMILHESEMVQGESDEDFDHAFKRRMLKAQEYIVPTSACVSLWFNCNDIARNLRKFCKFYNSQSIFGSCYILRREPSDPPVLLSPAFFPEIHSNVPKYPETLTEFKQKKDCLNFGIEFDRWKNYHVTNYHMDEKEDTDSAFYMFSDCWTEQELIITVHVLQEEFMNQYNDATAPLKEEMPGPPPTPTSRGVLTQPKTPKPPDIPLTLAIEPWDWRQGVSLTQPLLICTWIKDRWISHVSIPAGRNTFRIWLLYQNPTNAKGANSHTSRIRIAMDSSHKGSLPTTQSSEVGSSVQSESSKKKKNAAPFSVRIVSQTPIYVGSKEEVLSYMTNPPMLLLKQCERLANNLWGMFACFGKKFPAYSQNLRQLRRSYCPAYSQPNMINKFVRGTHDTFEELFVSLIATFNDGRLDRMMVLTLRILFLNPMIGRKFASHGIRKSEDSKMFQGVFRGLGKKAKFFLLNAANTIQRYYRGWRVRRLFQLRRRSHRDFKKIEYNVRRIAFLLASETDSVFSQKDYGSSSNDPEAFSVADMTVDPEKVPPTILPTPPHWAVDLLRFLMERHPWLITLYPHANCIPHHVKLQEVEGELPQRVKDFSWYPFFREVLKVPAETKSCFIELDLLVYPSAGIHMRVINNDNGKFLKLNSNRHFSGRLFENKYGYTVLCYKWTVATLKLELNDRPSSTLWKLRLVTPHDQDGPRFMNKSELYLRYTDSGEGLNEEANENKVSDEAESEGEANLKDSDEGGEKRNSQTSETEDSEEFPRKLSLRRLSGYYTPNKDYSVCQYILETDEKRACISLRFIASNENVRLKVLVWDCVKRAIIFEEIFKSGLIAPYIQLHLVKPKRKPSESDFLTTDNDSGDVRLTSPLSLEDLENSSGEFFDGIMNPASYSSKGLSKSSLGEDDEEEDEEWDGEETSRKSSSAQTEVKPSSKKRVDEVEESIQVERKVTNKRRYIISVYVMEESWPLTDRELLYVLYRERKFFKTIKAFHCSEIIKKEKERKAKLDEEAKATTTTTGRGSTGEADKPRMSTDQQTTAGKSGRQTIELKVTSTSEGEKPSNTTTSPNTAVDQTTPNETKYKDFQSVKRKTKKKDMEPGKETPSAPPPTQQGESNPQTAHSPPTQGTASETTIAFGEEFAKILAQKIQKDQGKIKRRGEGSLVVKYGGHQSQDVKHLDQPHWTMEIVTDSKTKYKLKSNWSILRKRLLLAKDSWEKGGVEVVYQDLSTRLDFLLENMVEENYYKIKLHKFSIVDPITNLYSILRLDEYDLSDFVNHEFIRLLIKIWSVDPEDNKQAGEKFLQNRLKKLRATEAAENTKDKDMEGETKPTPEQLLDYVPKNLRKMAEVFHQRITERELEREKERERERERQLQEEKDRLGTSNEEENDEDEEEEEEDTEMIKKKSTAPTEYLSSNNETTENLTVRQSTHHGGRSLRKTAADVKSERTQNQLSKKMKKVPTIPKLADNATSYTKATSKKVKSEKERSTSLNKGKEAKSTTAEVDSAPTPKRTSKAESGARSVVETDAKESEPQETYETELARIRQCEYVAGIFKKYEQFFKEPKTVKQTLTEVIERERQADNEEGPKKLLLTKTGISKYAEKGQEKKGKHDNEVEESVEGRKEEKVANKLLQWAYDYTFLPPTEEHDEVIQDPCDLPLFFMRTIMAEQRERERREEELAAAQAAAELAALEAEMEAEE